MYFLVVLWTIVCHPNIYYNPKSKYYQSLKSWNVGIIYIDHWQNNLKSKLLIRIPIVTKRLKEGSIYRKKLSGSLLQNIMLAIFSCCYGTKIIFLIEGSFPFPLKLRVKQRDTSHHFGYFVTSLFMFCL